MSRTPSQISVQRPKSGSNILGTCGILCATLSLFGWAAIVAYLITLITTFPERQLHTDKVNMNEVEQFIHLVYSVAAGGVLGIIGLMLNVLTSGIAMLLSCLGLAFQPRRRAVIGVVLSGISFAPVLLAIGSFVYVILASGNGK